MTNWNPPGPPAAGPPPYGQPPQGQPPYGQQMPGQPGPGYPMPGQPGFSGQPLTMDARPPITGLIVALLGALVLCVLPLFALASGDLFAYIGVYFCATVVLAIAVFLAVRLWAMTRPQQLVFDAVGMRWNDAAARSWVLAWPELAAVVVHTHTQPPLRTVIWPIQSNITVTVLLYPSEPGFGGRHPELAHLGRGRDQREYFELPLGPVPKRIPAIEQGMRTYAPGLYHGVVRNGTRY